MVKSLADDALGVHLDDRQFFSRSPSFAYDLIEEIKQQQETYMDQLAFTVREAGAMARVGRTLLYEDIRRGRLRAHKIGRRTVILAEDL